MSIQEQPVHYDISDQISSSSIVINRGSEEYDPFAIDDDTHENEQLTETKYQKQESIRINNGTTTHPVINNLNTSSSLDKPPSLNINEQKQMPRKSKSPIEHRSKHSDRRSRSPHRNHSSSSDRKRLRPSSPDSSTTTTVTNNESANTEIISSSKHIKSYRNDNEKQSKHQYTHRSSSLSLSSKSPSSNNNNNKKSVDSKDEKSLNSSDSRRSSKKDDYHSHRSNSSRSYHSSSSSSKYSSRDYPSSTHQSHTDHRTTNSTISSPSRIPSTTIPSDGNSSIHNNESNNHETSTEDRNQIYNRLKHVNDNNTPPIIPINKSNKVSSSGPAFINSNGGSQRSRSNLIQIVTTEATPVLTHGPPIRLPSSQIKPEPIKPISVPAQVESTTNTNDSSKSTTTSKTNSGTADNILMEEMLLEEEQEQSPLKSIDLDSLTIPETATQKPDNKDEPTKVIPTTSVATTTTTISTTTTTTITSASSLTPSPTKKPYTLYKVPHTNHMTPPLSSRHKKQTKKESSITESDVTTPTNKSSIDDNSRQTSLEERLSNIFGVSTNSSTEQQLDTRPNPPTQTSTSTPSDKSTESPQDIKSLILTMGKKERDHSSLTEKLNTNEDRRSTPSKHYTTEWLASQKPEEAPPTEELTTLPSLVTLPTLISSQSSTNTTKPSISNTGEATMIGKLSEAMSKLIQKQGDTTVPPTTEAEDAVPISAKHLERIERRKQREKRQTEIAAIAKEALKPAFKKHTITKDEYKEIMKKVVTKATHANEVDRIRIGKMIDAYVEKYRAIRQHNTSKTSTTSNMNGS